MSEMERNKGKLIPIGVDTELFSEEDFETYQENGFMVIDNEIYEVKWFVRRDTDCYDFAEVRENDDGSIDFHTYHYNGGACLEEVIEGKLKKQ